MTFEDHQAKAALMPQEELELHLRSLCADPRFAAVLRLVQKHRGEFVEAGCDQRLAADGNKQSHAWGSVYALKTLEEELRRIVTALPQERKRRRSEPIE